MVGEYESIRAETQKYIKERLGRIEVQNQMEIGGGMSQVSAKRETLRQQITGEQEKLNQLMLEEIRVLRHELIELKQQQVRSAAMTHHIKYMNPPPTRVSERMFLGILSK